MSRDVGQMSELNECASTDERAEQSEMLIGRREVVGEAVMRFAKYTAPVMLAVLISSHEKAAATAVTRPSENAR